MTMAAHPAREIDPFQMAREHFEALSSGFGMLAPGITACSERAIMTRGNEALRLAYQAWLDTLSAAERKEAARTPVPEATLVRAHGRQIESELRSLCTSSAWATSPRARRRASRSTSS